MYTVANGISERVCDQLIRLRILKNNCSINESVRKTRFYINIPDNRFIKTTLNRLLYGNNILNIKEIRPYDIQNIYTVILKEKAKQLEEKIKKKLKIIRNL